MAGKSLAKSVGLFFFVRIQSSIKLAALMKELKVSNARTNFKLGSWTSSSSSYVAILSLFLMKGFWMKLWYLSISSWIEPSLAGRLPPRSSCRGSQSSSSRSTISRPETAWASALGDRSSCYSKNRLSTAHISGLTSYFDSSAISVSPSWSTFPFTFTSASGAIGSGSILGSWGSLSLNLAEYRTLPASWPS